MECNLGWRLGKGSSLSFWDDRWLPHYNKLWEYALHPIPNIWDNLKVGDVIDASSGWNWDLFPSFLPHAITAKIVGLRHPSHYEERD